MTVMDLHDSLAAAQAAAVTETLSPYLTSLGLPELRWEVLDHGEIVGHAASAGDVRAYADCADLCGYPTEAGADVRIAGRWIRVVAS